MTWETWKMSKSRRQSSTSLPRTGFPDHNFDDVDDDDDADDVDDDDIDDDDNGDEGSCLPAIQRLAFLIILIIMTIMKILVMIILMMIMPNCQEYLCSNVQNLKLRNGNDWKILVEVLLEYNCQLWCQSFYICISEFC